MDLKNISMEIAICYRGAYNGSSDRVCTVETYSSQKLEDAFEVYLARNMKFRQLQARYGSITQSPACKGSK